MSVKMNQWKIVVNLLEADGTHHLEEIFVTHPSPAHAFTQGQAALDNQGSAESEIDEAWCYYNGETQ